MSIRLVRPRYSALNHIFRPPNFSKGFYHSLVVSDAEAKRPGLRAVGAFGALFSRISLTLFNELNFILFACCPMHASQC